MYYVECYLQGSKIVAPGNKPLCFGNSMAFRFLAGDVREEPQSLRIRDAAYYACWGRSLDFIANANRIREILLEGSSVAKNILLERILNHLNDLNEQ
ncbi:hypothetical protein TNCV_3623671 [Trichonephila clavipes]|nr:hypothetical protein TNCV_3623671 [Trichonephila clavipes]